jgi:hypothetical protein
MFMRNYRNNNVTAFIFVVIVNLTVGILEPIYSIKSEERRGDIHQGKTIF